MTDVFRMDGKRLSFLEENILSEFDFIPLALNQCFDLFCLLAFINISMIFILVFEIVINYITKYFVNVCFK